MSTLFVDGPAAGTRLELRRAPYFLRVVINCAGDVDALDQLDDEPEPDEAIHVYYQSANHGSGIACTRGKGCRTFNISEYKLNAAQPTDEQARDAELWRAWVGWQAEKEKT